MIKHSIIIPAYNEEAAIPVVLGKLLSLLDASYEIVVVDDGSRDRTAVEAEKFPVRTIRHPQNMGKGAAMRTGILNARGENVIFLDADNTYPAEAVLAIARMLEDYDMVVGIRSTRENIAAFNRFGNQMFSKLFKFIYNSKVSDPLSGLYGLKRKRLEEMELTSFGFEIETEIVIKASRMDLRVAEIPIAYDSRIGETKLNPILDGFRILRKLLTFSFVFNPDYSFIWPGFLLFVISLILFTILAFTSITIGDITLDIHSLIFSCMAAIVGFQIITFGLISKIYATLYKHIPADRMIRFILQSQIWKPLAGLGGVLVILGLLIIGRIFYAWIHSGFSPIMELHDSIVGLFLFIMGIQIIFSTFFLSIFAKDIINQESQKNFFKSLGLS